MTLKRPLTGTLILLFSCIPIAAISIYVLVYSRHASNVSLASALADPVDDGWYYYDGEGQRIPVDHLPFVVPDKGEVSRLYHDYRSDMSRYLCVYTHHQTLRVLLNGVMLYSYSLGRTPPWLTSYRSFYHIVELPPAQGSELCLELTANIPKRAGEFNIVYIGSRSDILFRLIHERLDKLLLGVMLFLCSLLFLFMGSFYNPNKGMDMTMLHLAMIVFFVGIWEIEESRLLQIVIGNQAVHWILEYVLQFLILFSSLLFVRDITPPSLQRITDILFVCDIATPFLQLALQISGVLQLVDSIAILWALFIVTCLYLAYLVSKGKRFKDNRFRLLFVGCMIVSALLFVTLFLGLFDKRVTDMCVSLAFVFIFVSLSFVVYQMSLDKFEVVYQSRVYKDLAMVDFNTGVSSHTAWFSFIEHFDRRQDTLETYCLILFDMNNLKKLNDTYGHLFGDKVIDTFCSCVKEAFGEKGTIYRVGGDEFICLCRDSTESEIHAMFVVFDRLASTRTTDGYHFTAAYGYVFFTPQKTDDFVEAQQRADSLMYEMKRLMKVER